MISTRGILLHHFKYGDSSVIAKVLTEEEGLLSFLLRGMKKGKGSKKGKELLHPLTPLHIEYRPKERGLLTPRDLDKEWSFTSIPFDVRKQSLAIFMAEVLYRTHEEGKPDPDLFAFLMSTVRKIDTEGLDVDLHIHFLARLTSFHGFAPEPVHSKDPLFFDLREGVFALSPPHHKDHLEPDLSHSLNQLLLSINATGDDMPIPDHPTRKALLNALLSFYHHHLESTRAIRSHKVLEEVFN